MKNGVLIAIVLVLVAGGLVVGYKSIPKTPQPVAITTTSETVTQTPVAENTTAPVTQKTTPAPVNIQLTVSSPASGTTVMSAALTVKGKTTPKADVYVNEVEAVADASGNFSVPVTLDEGENILIIMVVDADGNAAQKELTVTYDAGE